MKPLRRMRPLGVVGSLVLFFIPAAILYWTHFFFIPGFVSGTGYPYLVGYLIGWPITMALFFIAAVGGYKLESYVIQWMSFASRFRLMYGLMNLTLVAVVVLNVAGIKV